MTIVKYRYMSLHIDTYRQISFNIVTYPYISYLYISLDIVTYRYISLHIVTNRHILCIYVSLYIVTYRYISLHIVTYHIFTHRYTSYIVTQRYTSLYIVKYRYRGAWGLQQAARPRVTCWMKSTQHKGFRIEIPEGCSRRWSPPGSETPPARSTFQATAQWTHTTIKK